MHTGHSASGGGRWNTHIRVHTKQTHACIQVTVRVGVDVGTHAYGYTQNKHTHACIQVTVRVEVDVRTHTYGYTQINTHAYRSQCEWRWTSEQLQAWARICLETHSAFSPPTLLR